MIRVELPIPPSLNNAYLNVVGRGRVPSKGMRQWKQDAAWELAMAKVGQIGAGGFTLRILLNDKMRGDVDNRIKLISDLLGPRQMGVTPDDSRCTDASAARDVSVRPGRCIVIIEQVTLL